MDPGLNQLLKWGIENTENTPAGPMPDNGQASTLPSGGPPHADVLDALFGGPSDAELMKAAMAAITSPTNTIQNKLVAFENFEQLVEGVDNANNLAVLNLWDPLIQELRNKDQSDLRYMAAWCVGTAVQNNRTAQEHAQSRDVVPLLLDMALSDVDVKVRKKASYALSSIVRNYQPALDAMIAKLPHDIMGTSGGGTHDAGDMEAVDHILARIRDKGQSSSEQQPLSSDQPS
ncbi:MAG: hsp70 nucleotide exchange factor fes1 [Lichina confinis]|nr:MAG: hsp70 nucleotide exchange factor fes1 [Lichina confinis]